MPNVSISIAERKIGLNYLIKRKKILEEQLKNDLVIDGKHNCEKAEIFNAINLILKYEGIEIDEER